MRFLIPALLAISLVSCVPARPVPPVAAARACWRPWFRFLPLPPAPVRAGDSRESDGPDDFRGGFRGYRFRFPRTTASWSRISRTVLDHFMPMRLRRPEPAADSPPSTPDFSPRKARRWDWWFLREKPPARGIPRPHSEAASGIEAASGGESHFPTGKARANRCRQACAS